MPDFYLRSLSRRRFLNGLAAGALGSIVTRCENVKVDKKVELSVEGSGAAREQWRKPSAFVGLVQSRKSDVRDISYDEIKGMVRKAVDYGGGFDKLIRDGDVVVLKPNIMCLWIRSTGAKLKPEANGVTTDWRVTRAVVELVREVNPGGSVYVMESSAFQCTELAMQELKYTHEHIPGVTGFICLEESGGYREWDSPLLKKITLAGGVGLYPDEMKANGSREFYLNRIYAEADVLISLPVLKNHTHTGITGALKCVGIGATPANIYGKLMAPDVTSATARYAKKSGRALGLNREATINHAPLYLDMWIHDYVLCRPIDFVVTDGLHGLENGPDISNLTGAKRLEQHQMNMRLILAGRDALAVDTVHALLIGMDPDKVDHLVLLSNKNAGCINPARIRVKGDEVHGLKKPFAMNFERAARKMYSEYSEPEMRISSAVMKNGMLHLSLAVDRKKISKVEVAVDGHRLDAAVVDGYDNVVLNTRQWPAKKPEITVNAYDRYMNCRCQNVDWGRLSRL